MDEVLFTATTEPVDDAARVRARPVAGEFGQQDGSANWTT